MSKFYKNIIIFKNNENLKFHKVSKNFREQVELESGKKICKKYSISGLFQELIKR